MRLIAFSFLLLFGSAVNGQDSAVNFARYLKPRFDTLFYNCIYDSYHANGLHDTVALVCRTRLVGRETAHYVSVPQDPEGKWAHLITFHNSAMIYRDSTVCFASLHEGIGVHRLKEEDFWHLLAPVSRVDDPLVISHVRWAQFINSTAIRGFEFEDVTIGDTLLRHCLKLQLLDYDRGVHGDEASVWLHEDFGIVKWIRSSGRIEVLDIRRTTKRKSSRKPVR